MNSFMTVFIVIIAIALIGFLGYEIFCFVRDIKKAVAKRKEKQAKQDQENKDDDNKMQSK